MIRRILEAMRRRQEVPSGIDLAVETERLSSLIDGLAVNLVLSPRLVTPRRARAVLRAHLDQLSSSVG